MKVEVALIGDGGHSKVIRDLVQELPGCKVVALLDDKYERMALTGGVYRGPLKAVPQLIERYPDMKFAAAVGSNGVRKSIVARLGLPSERYLTLIHPTAVVSRSACIGPGTVVMAHAAVQADAKVGCHVIINTGAVVEHDTQLGDYVHAAPRATLTGSVQAGEGAMLGAAAVVIPGVSIGEWAVIGAGAAVIHPVPAYSTAVGVPARIVSVEKEVKAANGS